MTSHEDKQRARRVKSTDSYIQSKIESWMRMGTPAEINPLTGAACPKWKLEENEKRERQQKRAR